MKLQKTNDPQPKHLLPEAGLESTLLGHLHILVHHAGAGGSAPFRIAVDEKRTGQQYIAEGRTIEECADAVHAILLSLHARRDLTKTLPEPKKQLEA